MSSHLTPQLSLGAGATKADRWRGGIDPRQTLLPRLYDEGGARAALLLSPSRAGLPVRPGPSAALGALASGREYAGEIVHIEDMPARDAEYRDPDPALPGWLARGLESQGIERLYSHQAEAVERMRGGENLVVVSGTAGGKSLCFLLPLLERLAAQPDATALLLFPTKPLAQDQRGALTRLLRGLPADAPSGLRDLICGTYDGDTPAAARRALRDSGRVILSNPDMLHAGVLPGHPRWSRFFSGLSLVVIDEVHTYRGIFGSHVANVMRRLRRVAAHYGASPQFLMCSATIRNAEEQASRLVGVPVGRVQTDGAPRSPRRFVFWNPAPVRPPEPTRRSASVDAASVLSQLVLHDVPSIVFTKSRVVAELVYRYAKDRLDPYVLPGGAGTLADAVSPYRGGYLPTERRAIEARLFSGDLRAVVSTNALEMGIDVGSLDASVLVGFPPTIASTWQQVGRAGRSGREALSIVIAYEDPIDQYLIRHPRYFFDQTPEAAVMDPQNDAILRSQLACAAAELPLDDTDAALFGDRASETLASLTAEGYLALIRGRHFWAEGDPPARHVSLRLMSSDTVTIVEDSARERVLGTVDAISAPEVVYPGAIYLHEGASFFVRSLDLISKIATVEPRETDYYTQPVLETRLNVLSSGETTSRGAQHLTLHAVTVSWVTAFFKKIRYQTLESIGYGMLDLPPQTLETEAVSWALTPEIADALVQRGHAPREALGGFRNVMMTVWPILAMTEPADVGGIVESANAPYPSLFLYDRFPGGLGYARRAFAEFGALARMAYDLVLDCPCVDGCPSCVGLPVVRPAIQQDPDLGTGYPIPSKAATRSLLELVRAAWTDEEEA